MKLENVKKASELNQKINELDNHIRHIKNCDSVSFYGPIFSAFTIYDYAKNDRKLFKKLKEITLLELEKRKSEILKVIETL